MYLFFVAVCAFAFGSSAISLTDYKTGLHYQISKKLQVSEGAVQLKESRTLHQKAFLRDIDPHDEFLHKIADLGQLKSEREEQGSEAEETSQNCSKIFLDILSSMTILKKTLCQGGFLKGIKNRTVHCKYAYWRGGHHADGEKTIKGGRGEEEEERDEEEPQDEEKRKGEWGQGELGAKVGKKGKGGEKDGGKEKESAKGEAKEKRGKKGEGKGEEENKLDEEGKMGKGEKGETSGSGGEEEGGKKGRGGGGEVEEEGGGKKGKGGGGEEGEEEGGKKGRGGGGEVEEEEGGKKGRGGGGEVEEGGKKGRGGGEEEEEEGRKGRGGGGEVEEEGGKKGRGGGGEGEGEEGGKKGEGRGGEGEGEDSGEGLGKARNGNLCSEESLKEIDWQSLFRLGNLLAELNAKLEDKLNYHFRAG